MPTLHETLIQYSKPQLVAMARAAGLPTGDTARNSKEHYIALLEQHYGASGTAPAAPAAPTLPAAVAAAPAPTGTPDVQTVATMLAQLLASGAVNEQRVREIIAETPAGLDVDAVRAIIAEAQLAPKVIEVRQPDREPVRLEEHTHPVFEKVCRLVAAGVNVALVGPAGCGKSHLAAQVAKALGRAYGEINCTSGASESQLTGYLLPTGAGGAFEYHASPFVTLTEQGNSVFMFDELDAIDPNMALVANAALANGRINLPHRLGNTTAVRGANVGYLAGMNTWGTGADATYSGRNQLDGATMDRWYIVAMDYDSAFEQRIAAGHPELYAWVMALRTKVTAGRLRRVVSTRMLQKGCAALDAGLTLAEVKRDLLNGWTRDELAKVGE